MADIVQQDPPETHQAARRVNWTDVVTALKASPNTWHKIGEFSPGVATYLKAGRYKALYPDDVVHAPSYISQHYDITTRVARPGEPRVDLFMRWLP